MSDGRTGVTVPLDPETNELIEGQLGYGDYKAEWIRQAIYERLERDGVLNGSHE